MKTPAHLNALRAFEVTARLGSFTAPADGSTVTPDAIGQDTFIICADST